MTVSNQKTGRRGNAAEFLKAANFSLAFIQANWLLRQNWLHLFNQSAFCCTFGAVGKAIFDTRKYADYVT